MDTNPTPELHALDFRLSWGECDPAGIVYFAAWLPWMERVQTEWLYLAGERPDTMAARRGITMVVRAVTCEYLVPAKVFDPLRCALTGGQVGRTSVVQAFTITNRDTGAVHARSTMTVVFLDRDGRPTGPPDTMRSLWTTTGAAAAT
ncbi:MAG TPA: acyl-CoA thioesterase [Acidimicrobiales bacterium]|nr:acyl-CoA thioesterase [Acidimicrobiales bacterium]